MARTHLMDFMREDGTEVCVEYTISDYDPGVSSGPAEICYPPEGGEVEIVSVNDDKGNVIKWTDEEDEKWSREIAENHVFDDYDDGYDDYWRDDR